MLEIFPVHMTPFKEERNIRVFLPTNYQKGNKRYPVIYMHDGQNIFRDEDAIGGVSLSLEDYLIAKKLDVIVVGIDQKSEQRVNEYCPWINGRYCENILGYKSELGGKGGDYIDFITHELKPLIDHKYRTLKDQTAMGGISLGGLISVFAACKYPHIYKNITALSSAFYRNQEQIEEFIYISDLSSVERIYLDWGKREVKDDRINRAFSASNEAVAEILRGKAPNLISRIIDEGEHNYSSFKKRAHQFFSFLE
ncbi:alpha/beta hydrolase [Halobacillus sp. BBL2006]|uniref:alpha/beta hydrolase n=1 Tax=Halobacillus sp. BBL2006 TaxID=1543706 RepID=UPI00054420FE|nr:alpha/beta hydrolase-fold protein [Halobacillus sp. BBL2006]KHE68660.1 esterase [Halobacillus sp. BBL2006]